MEPHDLPDVCTLSNRIHPRYPERPDVLEEKFRLYPQGCFVLKSADTHIRGYCFSHPWIAGAPPSLDTFLEALPANPNSYFIHDLTLDRSVQRGRFASVLVPRIVAVARDVPLRRMALVAVNGSEPFWTRMGFQRTDDERLQASARAKYDASAVHMQRDLH